MLMVVMRSKNHSTTVEYWRCERRHLIVDFQKGGLSKGLKALRVYKFRKKLEGVKEAKAHKAIYSAQATLHLTIQLASILAIRT